MQIFRHFNSQITKWRVSPPIACCESCPREGSTRRVSYSGGGERAGWSGEEAIVEHSSALVLSRETRGRTPHTTMLSA